MKNFGLKAGLLVLSVMLLAACEITITPTPGLPSGLDVYDASYSTGFEADVNGNGTNEAVICDDRTTNLTYKFSFSGNLGTWESYLRGVETGDEAGRITLSLNSSEVSYNASTRTVSVNYEIRSGGAPRIVAPQAIVPRPKIEGYTRLFLEIEGATKEYDLISKNIPVLAACG